MSSSPRAIAEAMDLKRLGDRIQAADRAQAAADDARTAALVIDSESAMDHRLQGEATRKFYGSIVPYCAERFWRYAERNPAAVRTAQDAIVRDGAVREEYNSLSGANEAFCVEAIFLEIKNMVLDKIIADPTVRLEVRDWVRTNKDALVNPQHADHASVIEASRPVDPRYPDRMGYLASLQSVEQAAWRNFDPDAPIRSFSNLFVGASASAELRRRLAHYYLIATDFAYLNQTAMERRNNAMQQATTSAQAEQIEANFMAELADIRISPFAAVHLQVNFIGQLADIRRAHNEASNRLTLDSPSCSPGTVGRLSRMGELHPRAALSFNTIEFLNMGFTSIMKRALTPAFAQCVNLQSKINLKDSLVNFVHDGIVDGSIDYSDELYNIRQHFINAFSSEQNIIDEINAGLVGNGQPVLTPALRERISYMRRYYVYAGQAENITDSFDRSLTPAEALIVYPPYDSFSVAIANEYERVKRLEPGTDCSLAAMRHRVMQALVAANKWGNLGLDALNELIIPEEEKFRIDTYELAKSMVPNRDRNSLSPQALHRRIIISMIPNGARITDHNILDPLIQEMEQWVTIARTNCLLREYEVALRNISGNLTGSSLMGDAVIEEMIRLRDAARIADDEDEVASTPAEIQALKNSLGPQIEIAMQRGDAAIAARITAALPIPNPITNDNLNDLLDTFKDRATQETAEDLVYFPPARGRDEPQFLERVSAEQLFRETREKKAMHDRLAVMSYEQVCAALRSNDAFRASIDAYAGAVLGEGNISSVMDLLDGDGVAALEFMRGTGRRISNDVMRMVNPGFVADPAEEAREREIDAGRTPEERAEVRQAEADLRGELQELHREFGRDEGTKRCAIYTVVIGEVQKNVHPREIYQAGVGNNPPVIKARNPANRALLTESEMQSGELFKKVVLLAAKAAVDARPAGISDEQHAALDKALLITAKATMDANAAAVNAQIFGGVDEAAEIRQQIEDVLDDFDTQTPATRNALISVITAHNLIATPEVEGALNRLYNGEAVFAAPLMQALRGWGIGDRVQQAAQLLGTQDRLERPVPPPPLVIHMPQAAAGGAANARGAANAIPAGYNQAINEANVLAAGAAQPLNHSFPGPIQQIRPFEHHRLLSAGIGIAGPYQTRINIPQVPVILPYHPLGALPANARRDGGIPRFSLCARLPGGTLSNLPPGAAEYFVQNNINLNQADYYFVSENRSTENDPLEFRPHPWLHRGEQGAPGAPENGQYNNASHVSVAFADLNSRLSPLIDAEARTHGEGGEVVFSPNNMQILGLGDHNTSEAFYSLCINRETGRAAVTFHCLLNDQDQALLEQIVAQGVRGAATFAGIHAQMVGELPQAITDGLQQFLYGRAPGAVVQPVSRYSVQESLAARSRRVLERVGEANQGNLSASSGRATGDSAAASSTLEAARRNRQTAEIRALQIQLTGSAVTSQPSATVAEGLLLGLREQLRQRNLAVNAELAATPGVAESPDAGFIRQVREARALQIQLTGAEATLPPEQASRAWWQNRANADRLLQNLREQVRQRNLAANAQLGSTSGVSLPIVNIPASSGVNATSVSAPSANAGQPASVVESPEAGFIRQVTEARALQIQLTGTATTRPPAQASREWWQNRANADGFLQGLREQLRQRNLAVNAELAATPGVAESPDAGFIRQVREARALQIQLTGTAATRPPAEASRAWWQNQTNAEGLLQGLREQVRQRNLAVNAELAATSGVNLPTVSVPASNVASTAGDSATNRNRLR